jgi:hypothetical protein
MMRDSSLANGVMKILKILKETKKGLVKLQNKTCSRISKIRINLKARGIILLEHYMEMQLKFQDKVVVSSSTVNRALKVKKGSKAPSKLEKRAIRFLVVKEAPSFFQLELACKVFLNLNLNFQKVIQLIRTKAHSKCP